MKRNCDAQYNYCLIEWSWSSVVSVSHGHVFKSGKIGQKILIGRVE